MLTIGSHFPPFLLPAVVSTVPGKEFQTLHERSFAPSWLVVFAWPMDFTFVCPTEIAAFASAHGEFQQRQAQLLGLSTDTHYVHLAWRQSHPDLRELPFPLLADFKRTLSQELGIIHPVEGVDLRATFIVDPAGTVRYASAHDLKVGRSVAEVLRTLDALQSDALTPCNWKRGERTIAVA